MLDVPVENGALSEELCSRRLAWRHGGFSAHNEVGVAAEDAERRKRLAGYMLRAPQLALPETGSEPLEAIGVASRVISRVKYPQPRALHDLSWRAMAVAGGNG